MDESIIDLAKITLTKADPLLGELIKSQKISLPEHRSDYFASLVRSIIGQQVSVAAAKAIVERFSQRTGMKPAQAASLSEDDIRLIGLSKQKARYIRDLSQHFVVNPAVYNHLETKSDEEVIAELTTIKGVGVWTAQMFLMFTLRRPDVFAPDDAGLQRAMMRLYSWPALPPKKALAERALIWQPYRTIASLHLWQSLKIVTAQ